MLALGALPSPVPAAHGHVPVVEIVHWWSAPGANGALGILRREAENHGFIWRDVRGTGYDATREKVVKRLALGYAPTVIHWQAGLEVDTFAGLGMLGGIGVREAPADRRWYGFVDSAVRHEDHYIAIPLGLHAENWMWLNQAIYERFQLRPPSTWAELLAQASLLHENGVQPLAIRADGFQLQVLFNSIVLGHAGRDVYSAFYASHETPPAQLDALRDALDVLVTLRDLQRAHDERGTWIDATGDLAKGQAALQFMGDWVKPELTERGLEPGAGYWCTLAPGSGPHLLYSLDTLLFGRAARGDTVASQRELMRLLVDERAQVAFASAKGAVPVSPQFDTRNLDDCGRTVVGLLDDERRAVPSAPFLASTAFIEDLRHVLLEIWSRSDLGPQRGMRRLVALLNRHRASADETRTAQGPVSPLPGAGL